MFHIPARWFILARSETEMALGCSTFQPDDLSQPILKQISTIVFNQCRHHGLDWDPYVEATNLPDLLGLRLIGAYSIDNVRRALPRVRHKQLLKWFGCDTIPPADGPVERLLDAAAAAAALPSLCGSSRDVIAARRAAVEIADGRL